MNVLRLYGVRVYVSDVDVHIVGTSSGWREDRLGGTYKQITYASPPVVEWQGGTDYRKNNMRKGVEKPR